MHSLINTLTKPNAPAPTIFYKKQLVALKQTKMLLCRRINALHLLPPGGDEPPQFVRPNN